LCDAIELGEFPGRIFCYFDADVFPFSCYAYVFCAYACAMVLATLVLSVVLAVDGQTCRQESMICGFCDGEWEVMAQTKKLRYDPR
jgi:hypothetical protein